MGANNRPEDVDEALHVDGVANIPLSGGTRAVLVEYEHERDAHHLQSEIPGSDVILNVAWHHDGQKANLVWAITELLWDHDAGVG